MGAEDDILIDRTVMNNFLLSAAQQEKLIKESRERFFLTKSLGLLLHRSEIARTDTIRTLEVNGVYLTGSAIVIGVFTPIETNFPQIPGIEDGSRAWMFSCVEKMIHDVMRERIRVYTAELDGRLVALFCFSGERDRSFWNTSVNPVFQELCYSVIQKCKVNFNISVDIIISDLIFDWTKLSGGYRHATDALEYHSAAKLKMPEIYWCWENTPYEENERPLAKRLTLSIRSGDINFAKQEADECFSQMASWRPHTMEALFRRYYSLLAALQVEAILEHLLPQNFWIFDRCALSADGMRERLITNISELAQRTHTTGEAPNAVFVEQIREFIKSNTTDMALSVSSVAAHFKISQPLLSSRFKQQSGIVLSEYIHQVRLEEAKHLMQTTLEPLSVIAEKTGYASVSTFQRAFKKFEGTNPGTIRKAGKSGANMK